MATYFLASADFYIKRGDRLPPLIRTLKDADGVAVGLGGYTVRFNLKNAQTGAVKISRVLATPDADQVTNKGKVQFDWPDGSTTEAGDYYGEFEATDGTGKPWTFPNAGHIAIRIFDDLG